MYNCCISNCLNFYYCSQMSFLNNIYLIRPMSCIFITGFIHIENSSFIIIIYRVSIFVQSGFIWILNWDRWITLKYGYKNQIQNNAILSIHIYLWMNNMVRFCLITAMDSILMILMRMRRWKNMMKMMGWSSMRFILKCTWMRTSVECTLAVVWYSWD